MNTKQQLLSELNELEKQMELKLKKMKEIDDSISENELTERQTIFYNEEEKNNMRSQKNITFEYINIMTSKKILKLYDSNLQGQIKNNCDRCYVS